VKNFPDELTEVAFFALKKHSDQHDQFMDDYPSARHAAAEHRKTCDFCKVFDKLNKNYKSEARDEENEDD
jgi:hypothetical protein